MNFDNQNIIPLKKYQLLSSVLENLIFFLKQTFFNIIDYALNKNFIKILLITF